MGIFSPPPIYPMGEPPPPPPAPLLQLAHFGPLPHEMVIEHPLIPAQRPHTRPAIVSSLTWRLRAICLLLRGATRPREPTEGAQSLRVYHKGFKIGIVTNLGIFRVLG